MASFNACFSPLLIFLSALNALAVTFHAIEFFRLKKTQRLGIPGIICLCGFVGGTCRFCYDSFNPPYYSIRQFSPFADTVVFVLPSIALCIEYTLITVFWAELVSSEVLEGVKAFPTKLRPILFVTVALFCISCSLPAAFMNTSSLAIYAYTGIIFLYNLFILVMNIVFGSRILKIVKRLGASKSLKLTYFVAFVTLTLGLNLIAAVIYSIEFNSPVPSALIGTVYVQLAELVLFFSCTNLLRAPYEQTRSPCLYCLLHWGVFGTDTHTQDSSSYSRYQDRETGVDCTRFDGYTEASMATEDRTETYTLVDDLGTVDVR